MVILELGMRSGDRGAKPGKKGFGEGIYEVGLPVGQMPAKVQAWDILGGWSLLWIRVF